MRLLTVFLILSLTYAKKHRRLKTAKPDGPPIGKLLGQSSLMGEENFPRYHPVPFGHIYKDGFDPQIPSPIDYLELASYYVKDNPMVRQLVPQKIAVPIPKPKGFLSPKDEFYFGPKEEEDDEKEKKINETVSLDFVGLHRLNVNHNPKSNRNPSLRDLIAKRREENLKKISALSDRPAGTANEHKVKYLAKNTFEVQSLKKPKEKFKNWTTCKEFGKKADFHPKDIVNLEWIPFYIWSGPQRTMNSAHVHRFTYPNKKLVNHYKEKFGPHLNKTVNWEKPKLLLKETMEVLLIAADRKGLFDAVPNNEIPAEIKQLGKDVTVPHIQMRLKIVDPYLALMICDQKYAVIMANPGNEPTTYEDRIAEAKTLKFRGTGNPVSRDMDREIWEAKKIQEHEMEREKEKVIVSDY